MIVIRSLIPGGVAQQDGRIVPGDRLVYVNDTRLDKASLDTAVHSLKGASFGPVRLGIARPVNEDNIRIHEKEEKVSQVRKDR